MKFVKLDAQMVGAADPINGILYLKTTKNIVLLCETVGSTDPTNGILDAVMPETSSCVLLHETEHLRKCALSGIALLGGLQLRSPLYVAIYGMFAYVYETKCLFCL